MIQRMFVTLDTKKTNYKNVGKINHGDDLILELTVLSDGDMISFNDPMVDLLVKKSDGKMIRQNSGIEHIKPNKFIIEVSKDCVTSPGLATNQLIINDNGRISTCMFYYTILNSLEEDIIESISNVEVLEQLDEFTIQMKDKMENFDEELQNRMSELEDAIEDLEEFFGDTSVDLLEAELSRNEAEQSRAQAESVRVQNESRRLQNDLDLANAEAERVRAENIRIQNEVDRALVDAVMDQKESKREDSELERIQNESKRATDEVVRQQNENTRQSNESIRMSNENDRKTQENRRVTAETNRVNAETTRRNNENSRISNEIERQKVMNEMKSLIGNVNDFDERIGVIEDDVEEINSSLDNIEKKIQLNIKDYGALGDGISDDTEAFEKVFADIKQKQILDPKLSHILYFPNGVYLITKGFEIDFNLHIQGESVFESPLYRSYDSNRPGAGTIIKFKDKYNDITMFKRIEKKQLYFSNILLDGNDGIARNNFETPLSQKDMIVEFVTSNCNGVDLSQGGFGKGSENLYVTGFSGFGLKGSLWNRHNNFTANICGIGFINGGDDILNNFIITHCKNGIHLENNHAQLRGFRIEWCEEYGINCINGHSAVIEGFIDRCGYNGIKCNDHWNMQINVHIHRCGAVFRGFDDSQITNGDEKEKSKNFFGFGMRNSKVKIFDTKASVIDSSENSMKAPVLGNDLRGCNNCTIEVLSGGYEDGLKATLTDSIENSFVYANGRFYTSSIKTLDLYDKSRFRPPCAWTVEGNENDSSGDIKYEFSTNTLKYFNGTEWKVIQTN